MYARTIDLCIKHHSDNLKLSHSATYAGRDLSVLNSSEPCKSVCVSRRALRFIISCQQIFAAVVIEYDTVTICVLALCTYTINKYVYIAAAAAAARPDINPNR